MRKFDYSLLKEKKWDAEILNYISQISEYKGRQELYLSQKPTVLDNLVELAIIPVSYTHLTLPTTLHECRSRWSPYH